jgi:fumarylacetoacetase
MGICAAWDCFLEKFLFSSMSPWIITMDAFEIFKCMDRNKVLHRFLYLQQNSTGKQLRHKTSGSFYRNQNGDLNLLTESNFKYLYSTMAQQRIIPATDVMLEPVRFNVRQRTISGPTKNSYGSALEIQPGRCKNRSP